MVPKHAGDLRTKWVYPSNLGAINARLGRGCMLSDKIWRITASGTTCPMDHPSPNLLPNYIVTLKYAAVPGHIFKTVPCVRA